jgi:copper chaperone NosL
MFFIWSCSTGPQPIVAGKDQCHTCKMVVVDERFGTEIITKKNKVFKFDDVACMIDFMKSGAIEKAQIDKTYIVDYNDKKNFLLAEKAVFLYSIDLHSPMNGNAAAFSNKEEALKLRAEKGGEITEWQKLYDRKK